MKALHYKVEVTEYITYEMLKRLSDAAKNLDFSCLTVIKHFEDKLVFGVFSNRKHLEVDTYVCDQRSMFYERFISLTGKADKEYYFIVSNKMVSSIKSTLSSVKLSVTDELYLFPPSFQKLYKIPSKVTH